MSRNEKGFSVVEVVIMIVVIGLVGAVGWLVYDRQNNQQSTTMQNASETKADEESTETEVPTKITITEGSWELLRPSDVSKLPDITPASFKSFIATKLTSTPDSWGCYPSITITKITPINIKGYSGVVNEAGKAEGNCEAGGGGPVWALTPNGTWDETAGQDHADCTTIHGAKVYEEFAVECFAGANGTDNIKNPNGSVTAVTLE